MKNIAVVLCIFVMVFAGGCSPKAEPTLASVQQNAQPEVAEEPAEATATPKASDKDDFSSGDNWLAAITTTTQAMPGQKKSAVQVNEGILNFNMPDKETYMYTLYKNAQKADVSVEVTFTNIGLTNNGIALVCRVNEDHSAWYEARVSASGMYAFYKYDQALKKVGENPYKKLLAGTVDKYIIQPTDANTFKFTCKGDQLILEINGGQFTKTQQDADLTEGGQVGIGTMSYDVSPIQVQYDDFAISTP